MNERSTYIYVLCEPDGETVRYVGKTIDPTIRLRSHLCEARRGKRTYKNNWVRSVLASGSEPVLIIIEIVPPNGDWGEAERKWIAHYREIGCRMTNQTDGGEGNAGLVMSEEVRQRMSEAHVKRLSDPAERLKAAERQRGRKHSDETRERMRQSRLSYHLHTPEVCRKISEGKRLGWESRLSTYGTSISEFTSFVIQAFEQLQSINMTANFVRLRFGVGSYKSVRRILREHGLLHDKKVEEQAS